jgi:DNA topoisomerase-1
MPKKYSLSSASKQNILVIVESPSKCKKIEEYLGAGYKCIATFGHLRELSSLKNIDMDHQFHPTYTIIDKKREQIAVLQKEISNAAEVVLFTDADREGEAIAWHCCELFKLDVERTKRITCNEITESGVQSAINHPRTINMRLVHAQQARQVLDMLVGFQVTPTLWKHFTKCHSNSLSAGRCQTPALRIIYENQQEIELVKERKVYNTVGYFTNLKLPFKLNKQFEEESEMTEYLWQTSEFKHVYTCDPPKKVSRSPPVPFSTSKLQQASSNELRMSPKETMRVCQKLYEAGYITYMRTDSHKYSEEFIVSAKNYITSQYNLSYISETIEDLISTSDGEAHEAIRPTNISLLILPENMESKEKKMYKLIWENTLESCMAAATFHAITARIEAAQRLEFSYTTNLVDFAGWKIVSKKYQSELDLFNKEYHYLQSMKQDAVIFYIKVVSTVTLINTKSHYSEAMLVQELESKGIGRPSTFAGIVDKLQEREYVTKEDIPGTVVVCKDLELENNEVFEIETKREFGNEKNKLKLQPLGRMVMEFLLLYFNELFEYDFTQNMETRLDDLLLNTGEDSSWHEICKECNDLLIELIKKVSPDKMSVKIDDTHSYVVGKYGPVIKCAEKTENGNESVSFKAIRKDTNIEKLMIGHVNLTEVLKESSREKSYILGKHNLDDIILKKGKYGLYITWGKNTKNLKELGNRPIESITYDDIEKYLEQGSNIVREISSSLSIRKGAKGHYIFYKTQKMKQPTFHSLQGFKQDHEKCDVYAIKLWLKDTYNIS